MGGCPSSTGLLVKREGPHSGMLTCSSEGWGLRSWLQDVWKDGDKSGREGIAAIHYLRARSEEQGLGGPWGSTSARKKKEKGWSDKERETPF